MDKLEALFFGGDITQTITVWSIAAAVLFIFLSAFVDEQYRSLAVLSSLIAAVAFSVKYILPFFNLSLSF